MATQKNNENILELSAELRAAIEKVVDDRIAVAEKSCLRTYKATVVTAPNTTTGVCVVQMPNDGTQLSLPFSSNVIGVTAGATVWVLTVYGSWKNAIVYQKGDWQGTLPVVDYGVSSNIHYFKLFQGLLIQWSDTTVLANSSALVIFPKSYLLDSTAFTVISTLENSSLPLMISKIEGTSTTGIYFTNNNASDSTVHWVAIGQYEN